MSARRPPLRVVLDTNVLVAILAFDDPALEPLRTAWRVGAAIPLTDGACIAEMERVLAYPELANRQGAARPALDEYLSLCERIPEDVTDASELPICRDTDDQKFLALASRGRADALATRDKLLLELARRTQFAIVAPEALVARLAAGFDLDQCGRRNAGLA